MYYLLSLVVGILTAFSPCVIPLTPIILKSSISEKKYTAFILSFGLIVSFTIFGLIFGIIESCFDGHWIKDIAGIILIALGLSILFPKIKDFFHKHKENHCIYCRINTEKSLGQFLLGFILGMAWLPCSMHTFGVVIGLSLSNQQPKLTFLMFMLFAIGISIPLIGASWLAKEFLIKNSGKIKKINQIGNKILAYLIIVIGIKSILF